MFQDASDEIEEKNLTLSEAIPTLFTSATPGNKSEFTICLRFRAYYKRPEYVLLAAYVQNKTAVEIGKIMTIDKVIKSFANIPNSIYSVNEIGVLYLYINR